MPPASILSPLAQPFAPSREGFTEFASFDAIYNDGVPSLAVFGSHADHGIIHNIPDDAIDEIFPPDANDAAELDAVDDFLVTMVDLSFLEDKEELTRTNYGAYLQKRWEARRQNGLVGKPTRVQTMQDHLHPHTMMSPNEIRLVHFDRHHRAHNNLENRRRVMEAQKHAHQISHNRYSKKAYGLMHGNSKPIQQARKMNH